MASLKRDVVVKFRRGEFSSLPVDAMHSRRWLAGLVAFATPNLPPIAYTIAVSEGPKGRFAIALSDTDSGRW
jgi:hypothetical protein